MQIVAKDGGVQNHYRVFAPQKLEVHELTRTSIHEPNTDVAHYQGWRGLSNKRNGLNFL